MLLRHKTENKFFKKNEQEEEFLKLQLNFALKILWTKIYVTTMVNTQGFVMVLSKIKGL
jgi:hypothetical protein